MIDIRAGKARDASTLAQRNRDQNFSFRQFIECHNV